MNSFDRLHPSLQHHIANTLGWPKLRTLQESSIPQILDGRHALIIAPTAGGKTEAAILPVLSRVLAERWHGVSVLYICPLKALLNNIAERLERYFGMVGERCAVWHGDISQSEKDLIRKSPPACLLTTPESLEVLLISQNAASRELLTSARVVIIDELHAFARDDRGWHLLAVLERISRLSGQELQRIGLSATVGNPDELIEWLAGHCQGERVVVRGESAGVMSTDVRLDYVGTLENAATVIARLHREEKRLVFCDSRSRVERLATLLDAHGVRVFVSHSSLSAAQRREAEQAFAHGNECVILATSTLELGIDVGDLERVIQIDAPPTVASFLQRLGRTGRRAGTTRNCLFLATDELALLRCAAIISMWERGFVEPIVPPPEPLHLFSQQLMALSLQQRGIGVNDWQGWIARLPAFQRISPPETDAILSHLVSENILFNADGILSFGTEGEAKYGRKHFLELVSIFTSPPVFSVQNGREQLGTVEQRSLSGDSTHPSVIALAGRNWEVTHVDWTKRIAFVRASNSRGRSSWSGARVGMSFAHTREVSEILGSSEISNRWSKRAANAVTMIRQEADSLGTAHPAVTRNVEDGSLEWWTYAGFATNRLLADAAISLLKTESQANDFKVSFPHTVTVAALQDFWRTLGEVTDLSCFLLIPDRLLSSIKFAETLPPHLACKVYQSKTVDLIATRKVLDEFILESARPET